MEWEVEGQTEAFHFKCPIFVGGDPFIPHYSPWVPGAEVMRKEARHMQR